MRHRTLRLFLLVTAIAAFGCAFLVVASRNKMGKGQDQKSIDFGHYPLVEYVSSATDPSPKRKDKSKKYNSKHAPRISESSGQIFHITDWDRNLPALPASRSAAIVIGKVVDAKAYLSEDEANVYSEFSIRVDEILKNDNQNPLTVGGTFLADREGGRVRLPSGKIVVAAVSHQDMPRVGKTYVLFLTNSFPKSGETEGLYLLTAYELSESGVFPLDQVLDSHPIARYKGTNRQTFLTDLRNAIAGRK